MTDNTPEEQVQLNPETNNQKNADGLNGPGRGTNVRTCCCAIYNFFGFWRWIEFIRIIAYSYYLHQVFTNGQAKDSLQNLFQKPGVAFWMIVVVLVIDLIVAIYFNIRVFIHNGLTAENDNKDARGTYVFLANLKILATAVIFVVEFIGYVAAGWSNTGQYGLIP